MIRQHDTYVISQGTFRVVLTRTGRVAAVIEVEESALGPLHLLFEVGVQRGPIFRTGSFIDDVGHGISHAAHDIGHAAQDVGRAAGHAAEGTFNATSKVATTLARPAFNIVRDAAAGGMHLLGSAPLLPEEDRKQLEAASRVMMKARLGDIDAKQFVSNIAYAATHGVETARHVGDALMTGGRVVAHVLDTPLRLAEKVPLIGGTLHALSPFQKLEHLTTAIQEGNFQELKKIATDEAHMVQGIAGLVPGLGSGIGAAIGTGLAVLDGGGALDVAIQAAYGAIPIPPGIREVTDGVLEAVLKLAHQGSITDAVLAGARTGVPDGLPRQVFDTLAQLVIKRVPVKRAAEDLVGHYVDRYAPGAGAAAGIDLGAPAGSPVRLLGAGQRIAAAAGGR
jgi:hypothetical protein